MELRLRLSIAVPSDRIRPVPLYRRLWCVLNGGHYYLLYFQKTRLAQRCTTCGHVTRGWEVAA